MKQVWPDASAMFPSLFALWPLGEQSFRILIEQNLKSVPLSSIDGEESTILLGDAFIQNPSDQITRAIDISAPPGRVWQWLVQMLRGAGIYGWSSLEDLSCRSADYLQSDLCPPRVGDRAGDLLELAAVQAQNELVWRARGGLRVLNFVLDDLTLNYCLHNGRSQSSRLLARIRTSCPALTRPITRHLTDVVDFALTAHQLLRIKQLAEKRERPRACGMGRSDAVRHQAARFYPAGPGGDS